jgi:hypothetical protein
MDTINFIKQDVFPLESSPVSRLSFTSFLSDEEKQFCRLYKDYKEHDSPGFPLISKSYNIFAFKELFNLKNKFDKALKLYVEKVLHTPTLQFKNTGSWLTKNTKETSHHPHGHSNTMLSVVTYFDDDICMDKELPGIVFLSHKLSSVFPFFKFNFKDVEVSEWNLFNYETYTIKPKYNDVIIFPGHLRHTSEINHTDSRYCIGANYFITGEIGNDEGMNKVTL